MTDTITTMTDSAATFTKDELIDLLAAPAGPRDDADDMIALDVHRRGPRAVAVVTLDRPRQHNALGLAAWTRLAQVFQSLTARTELRAVVIRGAGDKAFSAGADIAEFPRVRLTPQAATQYNSMITAALRAIEELPIPVIAMVSGLAVGGGCELAAAADIRIVSADSRFGIPIGRLGVTLGLTETRAVSRIIGRANLFDLLASGRLIDAERAADWGYAQRVVAREDLTREVAELVLAILAGSEATIRAAKVTLRLSSDPAVDDEHDDLRALHDQAYGGADLQEGVTAFLEGRPPRFGEQTA